MGTYVEICKLKVGEPIVVGCADSVKHSVGNDTLISVLTGKPLDMTEPNGNPVLFNSLSSATSISK